MYLHPATSAKSKSQQGLTNVEGDLVSLIETRSEDGELEEDSQHSMGNLGYAERSRANSSGANSETYSDSSIALA